MKKVQRYKRLRRISMEVNSKFLKKLSKKDYFVETAKVLGILGPDNVLIFEDEEETSVLMDCALHEYRINGLNAFEKYRDKVTLRSREEREALEAYISSYSSLFRVEGISKKESSLTLYDILNEEEVEIIDVMFSQTAIQGLVLFFRLIPFKDFYMTNGVVFPFPPKSEMYLLELMKSISKEIPSKERSFREYAAFFKIFRKAGLNVSYE